MADLTGQQIGRYRILRPISSGGMATTYLAVDTLLGARQVAIKTFPIHSNEQLQRKERESNILVKLNHPNILRTFDFGREADIFYIVNEYIPEGTLRQRHPRGARVPLTTVISYVKQVAAALQYLHDRGIVHRDVKPHNILISSNGRVVLGDFGVATTLSDEDSDEQTHVAGTPIYMAPEQFLGRAQYASDQYALGVVVYEWLSGELPFSGRMLDLATKHLHGQPAPLSAIVSGIPHGVDEVVMRALAKQPQDRYPSVLAFADALEQASRSSMRGIPEIYPSPTVSPSAAPSPTHDYPPPPVTPGSANPYGTPLPPYSYPPPTGSLESVSPSRTYGNEEAPYPTVASKRVSYPNVRFLPAFRRASQTLSKFFPRGGGQKRRDTELSLFAIARTTLEQDDRAIVGNTYTVQAGISQQEQEDFRSAPFKVSVQDPSQPILFHILFHPSENIELLGGPYGAPPYQRLSYNPGNAEPQFISWEFRLKAPGQSYLLINFYRERQWLKTIRFEFDDVERSMPSYPRGGEVT